MFLFCLVFAMSLCASVYMCFVVTCFVSIPDLYHTSYFVFNVTAAVSQLKPYFSADQPVKI